MPDLEQSARERAEEIGERCESRIDERTACIKSRPKVIAALTAAAVFAAAVAVLLIFGD